MATVSNVSQQLIAESAMQGFMDYIVPITAFSFGVASDAAVLNDIISVPTVKAVSGSSTYSYTDGIRRLNGFGRRRAGYIGHPVISKL